MLYDACSNLSALCSLDSGESGVVSPESTYLLLDTGISDKTANFTSLDFATLNRKADSLTASLDLVVHTEDSTKPDHSFLFWSGAVEELDNGTIKNYGLDYVAQTISVSTTCSFATRNCNFTNTTSEQGHLLYNCANFFTGALNEPQHGSIEKVDGWATKFYDLINGTFQSTPERMQSNPINFFLAGAIKTSIAGDIQDYIPIATEPGDLFVAGSGQIALVLQCTTGVYNVEYTLSDGNITDFIPILSNSSTATIVTALFRLGFGTYNLFQRASSAILSLDDFRMNMQLAMSEVIIAGSYGAFTYGPNLAQRFRWDQTVTQISRPALLYFIIICLLYSALGFGLMIAAFVLRAKQRIRET